MALGFERYNFSRSLSRKRIVVSMDGEASHHDVAPLKRVCSGKFNFNSDTSPLEALPFDVLIKVLCGVDHEDLKQLLCVSKTIKEATGIARKFHFEYSTPKKRTFAFLPPVDADDGFDGIEAPNAPPRKSRSRLNGGKMGSISVNLFASMDEEQ